jgi:heme exporter protein D
MKRAVLFGVTFLFAVAVWAQQQSLADIARQNRTQKKGSAAVRLNDDNMPRSLTANADENAPKTDDKTAKDSDKAADKDKDKDAKAAKPNSEQIVKAVEAQKQEINRLQRELDVAQREQRLRAAAFYGDAGTMLRDQGKYLDDSRKLQDEIDGKKQALDTANKKLAELQEQARKAGLSSTAVE